MTCFSATLSSSSSALNLVKPLFLAMWSGSQETWAWSCLGPQLHAPRFVAKCKLPWWLGQCEHWPLHPATFQTYPAYLFGAWIGASGQRYEHPLEMASLRSLGQPKWATERVHCPRGCCLQPSGFPRGSELSWLNWLQPPEITEQAVRPLQVSCELEIWGKMKFEREFAHHSWQKAIYFLIN